MRGMGAIVVACGLALLTLTSAGCEKGPVEVEPAEYRQVLLMIDGLSSTAEVSKVRANLRRVPGVRDVVMDLPNAEATVTYDRNLANEYTLQEAVDAAGFDAKTADPEGP